MNKMIQSIRMTAKPLGLKGPVAALSLALGTTGAVIAPLAPLAAQASPSSDVDRAVTALRSVSTLREIGRAHV